MNWLVSAALGYACGGRCSRPCTWRTIVASRRRRSSSSRLRSSLARTPLARAHCCLRCSRIQPSLLDTRTSGSINTISRGRYCNRSRMVTVVISEWKQMERGERSLESVSNTNCSISTSMRCGKRTLSRERPSLLETVEIFQTHARLLHETNKRTSRRNSEHLYRRFAMSRYSQPQKGITSYAFRIAGRDRSGTRLMKFRTGRCSSLRTCCCSIRILRSI